MIIPMKKKLQQNNGASMILALVLFLICAMISSVVIVAASSGSSRNVNRTANQRAYLAVSSAATLLMEEMEKSDTCTGRRIETEYGCKKYGDSDNYTTLSPYPDGTKGYRINDFWIPNTIDAIIVDTVPCQANTVEYEMQLSSTNGILSAVLLKATEEIYSGKTSYSEDFTISLTDADERLPVVQGTLTMNVSYDITIKLFTADNDYSITLSVPGDIEESSEVTAAETEGCNHRVYYKLYNSSNESYEVVKVDSMAFTASLKTTTHTISWGTPVLEKGGTNE